MKQIISRIVNHLRKVREAAKHDDGFSLLELLIVIVIIGILGTIVYTRFMSMPGSGAGPGRQPSNQEFRNTAASIQQYPLYTSFNRGRT